MARIGRGFPSRITAIKPARSTDAIVELETFATVWEFPALEVTSPSIGIELPVFATTWEFPALEVVYDTEINLTAFSTVWEFPPLAVDTPILPGITITRDGEIEWRGVLWSSANKFRPQNDLAGWDDLPGLDSGNAPRANDDGSWAGPDYPEQRSVSVTVQIDDQTAFAASRKAIRDLLTPGDDESEYPLVIRISGETLLAYGKVAKRIIPSTLAGIGKADVAIQWVCADPYRYWLTEFGITVTPEGPQVISNGGGARTKPRLRFHGPASVPRIRVAGRILAFQVELGAGDVFDVNCRTGDTTIGELDYVRVHDFSVAITDLVIPPGDWELEYIPDSGGAAGVDVFWRPAES
ncbi:hypothetical protein Ssi03_50380 [Sphaerisporangium siamense]|uniref:Phage tail protein n=1 Tax=Sphaerisporangium siamense TaxID=795645 RepID=A0A7W7D8L9_9ACTN|nr:hypothetical protein [Sphaerisporangium siamense]MBB4702257.1 hypothetical protein [Sphaerisporangium siamense]GII87048.1 hypothetical protein Ssi03_50380 [Sphaerisporangium siamense]